MSAHNSGVPAGWREVLASLAQIVYTQNGNQEDTITALLDQARGILAAPAAPQAVPGADLVTRESALQAIEHLNLSNSAGREIDAREMLVAAPVAQAVPVAGEWVSVDERLPENDEVVLVYSPNWDIASSAIFWVGDQFNKPAWLDDGGEGFLLDDPISHWMPLPPAPRSAT